MIDSNLGKLVWDEKYSVGVELIDNQHKRMFETINQLVSVVTDKPTPEKLAPMLKALLEYKQFHFATEEKYFRDFNYEGAEEHIKAHALFAEKLAMIQEQNKDNMTVMTYELLDFLEDWLLDHLMTVDQEYVECFHTHGLK